MKNVTEKQLPTVPFKTLPEFELLQKFYPRENWLLMGTLTHARPTSAETQLRHFRELVHAIGKPNNTFGHRLHWVCRVGGGAGTSSHIHLHFLLGKHHISNGHEFAYNPDQLIALIEDNWTRFGMKEHQEISIFDSSRPGVEYVLRGITKPRKNGGNESGVGLHHQKSAESIHDSTRARPIGGRSGKPNACWRCSRRIR